MQLNQNKIQSQTRACSQVVLEVLTAVFSQGKPADRTISDLFRQQKKYGSRDRRFISETLFAVLRWWGWLQRIAPTDTHSPKGWDRVLLGAWLLETREKLPDPAKNWMFHAGLSEKQCTIILDQDDPLKRMRKMMIFFGLEHNLSWENLIPEWSLPLIINSKGGIEGLVQEMQFRPPVWLRVQGDNPDQVLQELKEEGIEAKFFSKYFPAIALENSRVNLRTLPAFVEGRVEIQDLASQVIGEVCQAKAGERWWDTCAGGGGKTLQLSTMMKRKGSVLATDIREFKLDDLKERAKRAKMDNIRYKQWSDKQTPPSQHGFDGVLVDAPCSCSGTWRRNPDARWLTTAEEVVELSKLQLKILSSASRGVGDNGVLVYATCSMFKIENENVVRAFLREHKEFDLEPFDNPLNGKKTNGLLQVWPSDGNCDAMFVARMRRKKTN